MRALLFLTLACGPGEPDEDNDTTWDRGPNPHPMDDVLRMNHVQVKGTHNSYHLEPASPVDDSHRYSQPTLTDQLDLHHVRQLELDVHLRTDGTWGVFHIPAIDDRSTCEDFSRCLQEIKDWSDANGWHLPLVVWLEPKDDIDAFVDGLMAIDGHIHELDDAIHAVWPPDRLLTPDDLRGGHPDLPAALVSDGWPLLGEARGRVLFALLDAGAHRDAYTAGNPTLEGRVLFVDTSSPDDPWAAAVKDGSYAEITEWAESGFLITTNGSGAADDPSAAEADDLAARAAGIHHLATDLPAPGGDYWLDLPPSCNPVTAPAGCTAEAAESL